MVTTIALLGATGKTGREVLRRFLEKPDVDIRLYVRSHSKLVGLFPNLACDPRISIFPGPIEDVDNMIKCLDGATNIIFALGENNDFTGSVRIIESGAKTVIVALAALRKRCPDWSRPRLLMLSSATWNDTLNKTRPPLIHWAIKNAFYHGYVDLRAGTAIVLGAPSLVNVLLVQPNGLVEGQPSGHEINTERATFSVTYGDLGAAFVDLACMKEYDTLSAVGVSSKDGDNALKYGPTLGYTILRGLCATYIPGYWPLHQFVVSLVSTLTLKIKGE
ncbi:uncharacterized protein Z518_02096 [Rhinocladiella mackenziei CBS 650.93]|uniref:NAD(P)-binding domain-containing protein n=1 Tax=Rhinocladiella mackenziei CBS 650.93 TaxID=1442369 RepID=A0A0D2HAF1_9EURO|nr:uncharacterized protein Z518_02096 [Rhinocladiella mackenziei CBS 650.93]KIX07443.1 hypothetical protein Z518_02096 [Rhinocladiella mackenziei CBS 650.93]